MKKLLPFIIALLTSISLNAFNFSIPTEEGIMINYSVTSSV
jgi:hypothetical protein